MREHEQDRDGPPPESPQRHPPDQARHLHEDEAQHRGVLVSGNHARRHARLVAKDELRRIAAHVGRDRQQRVEEERDETRLRQILAFLDQSSHEQRHARHRRRRLECDSAAGAGAHRSRNELTDVRHETGRAHGDEPAGQRCGGQHFPGALRAKYPVPDQHQHHDGERNEQQLHDRRRDSTRASVRRPRTAGSPSPRSTRTPPTSARSVFSRDFSGMP